MSESSINSRMHLSISSQIRTWGSRLLWYASSPPYALAMECCLAYVSALPWSREATTAMTARGWLFAGLMTALKAILDVPRIPNRTKSLSFGTEGGYESCKWASSISFSRKVDSLDPYCDVALDEADDAGHPAEGSTNDISARLAP